MSSPSASPGCLGLLLRLIAGRGEASIPDRLPYERREYFFSVAERSFYGVLCEAVGDNYRVFAKVRLADLLLISKNTEKRQSHLNRIASKHIDFLICSRDVVAPLLAVELDDASHARADRAARDSFVDAAFAAAKLPVLHVEAQRSYNVSDVRRAIEAAIRG